MQRNALLVIAQIVGMRDRFVVPIPMVAQTILSDVMVLLTLTTVNASLYGCRSVVMIPAIGLTFVVVVALLEKRWWKDTAIRKGN